MATRMGGAYGGWLLVACAMGTSAMAEPPPKGAAAAELVDEISAAPPEELPPPSAPLGEKRPRPSYAGRPPEPTGAGHALLWVPRVLLYPVHLTLEATVRWPLKGLATVVERHHVVPWLQWLFFWNDNRAGLFPTFFYEFGLDPSVGVYFFWNDLFWPGHDVKLHGAFWTNDWESLRFADSWRLTPRTRLSFDGRYERRPDRPFYGIGPLTFADNLTYYRQSVVHAWTDLTRDLGALSKVGVRVGYRRSSFRDGEDPPISSKFDAPTIPGFEGYSLVGGELQLRLDSRRPSLEIPDRGVRLDLFGSYDIDPGATELSFIRWGGNLAGIYDFTGRHHIVTLEVFTAFVEQLGSEPVPFTELIVLGGIRQMSGYKTGRFRGESALEITGAYRYPIWAYLDAELFVSLGNTYDRHLDDIAFQRMYLCWGMGFRTAVTRDNSFELLFGFGTNRLDSPSLSVTTFNFAVGFHPALEYAPRTTLNTL